MEAAGATADVGAVWGEAGMGGVGSGWSTMPPPKSVQESGGRRALIVTCGLFAAPFAAATVPVAFAAVTCRGDGRED